MSSKNNIKKPAAETITIRPTTEYKGISEKLKAIARKDKRSLNNFVLIKLQEVVDAQ